jgi:hypothetical protein
MLQLSAEESMTYRDFGELCRREIDLAISGHSIKKANQHVIQAILRMRLFCNDGEVALAKKMGAHGLPADPEEALSYLQTSAKSGCVKCDTDITTMYHDDDPNTGKLTICQHLICGECLPTYEGELDSSEENGRTQCPECGLYGERTSFISPGTVSDHPEIPVKGKYPTKLRALLSNIETQSMHDKWYIFHRILLRCKLKSSLVSCSRSGRPPWILWRRCLTNIICRTAASTVKSQLAKEAKFFQILRGLRTFAFC